MLQYILIHKMFSFSEDLLHGVVLYTVKVGHQIVSFLMLLGSPAIVSKGARIRNRYHQVPHLTQDTNGKETNSQ